MSTVRWGILGAGRIAHRFAASLAHDKRCQLVAVSGRTPEKVAAFAAAHGVAPERAYADGVAVAGATGADGAGSAGEIGASDAAPAVAVTDAGAASFSPHERLLADKDVDAIYLALPHGLHRAWAIRALEAGKAVLCEKPAALTAGEIREIAAAAERTGGLFMEAMKTRFVPLYAEVRRLLGEGAIGELLRVETSLCNAMPPDALEGTYLLDGAQGGVLLDCGIYCASWIEDLLPAPFAVTARQIEMYRGVDAHVNAELVASDGRTAALECAFDRAKPRQAVLVGSAGRIVVEDLHRPQRLVLERQGCAPQVIERPYVVDDFYGEVTHFTDLICAGAAESPVMPLAASVRCAEILDAVRG